MDAPKLSVPPQGPGRIIWLASYPKSGNTWMRMVIGQLLGEGPQRNDINALAKKDGIASGRESFDDMAGVDAADLPHDIVDNLRPGVYERLSLETERTLFIKTHDAYLPTPAGEPLFPLAATQGVIHIVRNPLDVAVSLAHHSGMALEKAVVALCNPSGTLCAETDRLNDQLRQRLLDWQGHTASWLNSPLPRLTVRYEDMLAQPQEVFGRIATFCDLHVAGEKLQTAIEACRFERLRELETQSRFRETPRKTSHFFREGRSGGWQSALLPEQVTRILSSQGRLMAQLGYNAPQAPSPIPPHTDTD